MSFIGLVFLFSFKAHAEYRVFELVIKNTQTQTEKKVISNLDPEQYAKYYPVSLQESISYQNTWMCPGRTGDFKPYCNNPRNPAGDKTSLTPLPPQ